MTGEKAMDYPRCNSSDTTKTGKQGGKQKYFCNDCKKHFLESYQRDKPNFSSGTRDRYWENVDWEKDKD